MTEDEYRRFLEHKLRKLGYLIHTAPGIDQTLRVMLAKVLQADSFVGIELEGEE
jgi:hypothetical protein